jgi:putative heme iron utilization protein
MAAKGGAKTGARQLLHLVFGGELATLDKIEFSDLKSLDIVGIYPNYAEAYAAWRDAAHRSVDDAHMRYFIVHLYRLLDPETESGSSPEA